MKTSRMEAFSDGVIAVIITIMVLEIRVPRAATMEALQALAPSLLVYGLSFLVVAIMWVNHHHFLEHAQRAEPALLWTNNNLLFWMSLTPFVTGYLGEYYKAPLAVACYGLTLGMTSLGFLLLQTVIMRQDRENAQLQMEFRHLNRKAMAAMAFYGIASGAAYFSVYISYGVFTLFPLLYFWPEHRDDGGCCQRADRAEE